jgi:hypothetical protein
MIVGHPKTADASERELLVMCSSVYDHEYDSPMPGAARVLRVAVDLGLVRRNLNHAFEEDDAAIECANETTKMPLMLTELGREWLTEKGWV